MDVVKQKEKLGGKEEYAETGMIKKYAPKSIQSFNYHVFGLGKDLN